MQRIVLWSFAMMFALAVPLMPAAAGWMNNSPAGMATHAVKSMAADSAGGIWIAGSNTGVYGFYKGNWIHELEGRQVQALTVDAAGVLRAFVDGAPYQRDAGGWVSINEQVFGNVDRAVVDAEGTVWAMVDPAELSVQLVYFQDDVWNGIGLPIGQEKATALAVGPDNVIWVGTSSNGLYLIENELLHHFDDAMAELPSSHVLDIVQDGNGAMWVATDLGVARYDETGWKVFTKGKLGIPESRVPAIAVDKQNGLWALTRPLARHYENMWDTVSWPGFTAGTFTAVVVDRENYVWLGADDGRIAVYDGITTGVDPVTSESGHPVAIYPNPFTGELRVEYTIPERLPVTVMITDMFGREIRTLVQDVLPPGDGVVVWDGLDDTGRQVSAGMYYCRLAIGKAMSVVPLQKMP